MSILFAIFALAVFGFQAYAEPTPQGYDVDYPTTRSYPNCPNFFPCTPYHYFCKCNFYYCLDSYIEDQAEYLARQTTYIFLCDIQQMFILVENVEYGIDYENEVDMVTQIVLGLQEEILNCGYRPMTPPDYCSNFSDMDLFSPMSAFTSESAMNFYNSKMDYFLWKTMPQLSENFQQIVYNAIYYNTPPELLPCADELYYKMCTCLRSILSNMIDTPYPPYPYYPNRLYGNV